MGFAKLDPNRPLLTTTQPLGITFFAASLVCNIVLNIFATLNIMIRLLCHRRKMIMIFGRSWALSKYQLRITGILLESAVLNIPVTLLGAIALLLREAYTTLIIKIIVPAQV